MNWDHMCPSCMHELTDEESKMEKCPHCGFEREKEDREQALPVLTILNGKYLIGKILEKDSTGITYQAYDLNLEICIQITEYFPPILAKRAEDDRTVIPLSEDTVESYEQGKKNNLDNARQFVKMVTLSGGENMIRDFFEEYNTVYTVLIDKAMPSVTSMPQNCSEEPLKKRKKKKIVLFSGIGAGVLAICIFIIVLIIGANSGKFKVDKDWESVYKSNMLGTSYDEDIVVFATDNSLYYGEYDSNGKLPEIYWLADLNVNEAMYCVAADKDYLYVSVTNYGIFRADIEDKKVEYRQIVSRDTLEFILYDKYIYYAEGDILYRAKNDGSGEQVLAENASGSFSVYKNSVFYYSNEDECIYRIDENGEEIVKILQIKGVTNILLSGANLWLVENGILYQIDIETGEFVVKEGIDSVGSNWDIYVSNNTVYYLSEDSKVLNAYNVSNNEKVVLYDGNEIIMTGMLNEKLYVLNSKGEYYSLDLADGSKTKMNFNYMSMSQDCLHD